METHGTVEYRVSKAIPIVGEADVVVVGGGPGGIGAAVMAARAGARTLLVERFGLLGGMATVGEVHPFMPNHVDGRPLDGPVYTDWLAKMALYQPSQESSRQAPWILKEAAALAAEDLCAEAGCEILYHHLLADVITEGSEIRELVFLSKSGYTAVRGSVCVDCTGDADVAAKAGCECEEGGPRGHSQPMTLCFKLSHVDTSRAPERKKINELYEQARKDGEVDCPRDNILSFQWFDDDVVHFNTTRVIHRRGTSGVELSNAEQQAHSQVKQLLAFFRKHVPGYENAQIRSMGHHIGIRETRRVRGRVYLTRAAFDQRAKSEEAIARVRYMIDIHNPDGAGTEHARLPEGEWYEIPYGCIVARDVDNLTIGGRPISVDHALHSSMRVMPPACTIGQAAGLAAALAAKGHLRPCDLNGVEVRNRLVAMGARLQPVP